VVCGHFHVRPELVFQVGVAPAWKQRSLKTLNPFAKDAHAISLELQAGQAEPALDDRL
jgi:hypothetical protein